MKSTVCAAPVKMRFFAEQGGTGCEPLAVRPPNKSTKLRVHISLLPRGPSSNVSELQSPDVAEASQWMTSTVSMPAHTTQRNCKFHTLN